MQLNERPIREEYAKIWGGTVAGIKLVYLKWKLTNLKK